MSLECDMDKQNQDLEALLICGVQAAESTKVSFNCTVDSISRHGYLRESAYRQHGGPLGWERSASVESRSMLHTPLHCSDEGRQGAGHELCYHCTLSGLSCMHHADTFNYRCTLSQNSPVVGYKWKVGVGPYPVISGSGLTHCLIKLYRRLWLFSVPHQLGAYYYIRIHYITVTRPGLLSACALNRMLQLERVCVNLLRSDDRNTKQNTVIAMAQEGFAVQGNPDHTFVKKNRVIWHWGACHLRSCRLNCSTFTIDHMFGYRVLPHAGRGYNNATR